MADSEASAQDKTKEKKKKKIGSTKEKEPRKKSGAEADLQTDAKSLAAGEPQKGKPQEAETSGEAAASDVPAEPQATSTTPESTKKSKKSKTAAKSDEAPTTDGSVEGRKASVVEGVPGAAGEGPSTPSGGASRKASAAAAAAAAAAAPVPEEDAIAESVDAQSEEQAPKPTTRDLPPPIEASYVVPPPAAKKDINLLQDIDENKLVELKELFELFDYNQDGIIDSKDLKVTYQTLGYTDISDDFIEDMLSEAMSPLDFDAFVILLGYKTIEMDPESVLVGALSCWDLDNTGLISEDRIKHDLQTWGDKFTPEEAEMALEDAPIYVSKKGVTLIDYIKFSNTLCGLRKK